MAEQTFEAVVEAERERLKSKRSEITDKIKALEKELVGIDREAEAVNAYYAGGQPKERK